MRELEVFTILRLSQPSGSIEFHIDEVLGVGGSCIAYRVSYYEAGNIRHRGILKELCPVYLTGEGTFQRSGTAIPISESCREQFEYDKKRFVQVYREINDYLSENLSAANYHTVQLGLYEGNGTLYTLTSCDYGKSYDKVTDPDLHTLLKIILAVTKAVELYHNAGYLHLDIKPKNVLILDEVSDIVKLFDFDSLTPIDGVKNRSVTQVPIPEDYYVPELEHGDLRNITIQTDIFEIGAMLYLRLFGKAPVEQKLRHGSKIDLDRAPLLTGISPRAKYLLQDLFARTLQISRRSRYRTTGELKSQLEQIIDLVSGQGTTYLLNLPKWQPSRYCVGRAEELKSIKQQLDQNGYVFIKALGGLGKSELAKLFARTYADEYHTVQFCKYNDSLSVVTASLAVQGIRDEEYSDFEELVRQKNKVLHMADEHTLLIVDNFNVTHDEFLRDFLPADRHGFKVIFTTRCQIAADYYADKVLELKPLGMRECKYLFYSHSGLEPADDETAVETLITTIERNTLVLILLATAIKKSGITPEQMQKKLEEQRLHEVQADVFHEYDHETAQTESYNKIYAHLNAVFSVSDLSPQEKEVLKNLTLIPYSGIEEKTFIEYCNGNAATSQVIRNLIHQSWVESKDEKISLHPIVSDLIAANRDIPKGKGYAALRDQLGMFCNASATNHFALLTQQLAYATHLVRRCTTEGAFIQSVTKARLGRLYREFYSPDEARKNMLEAVELAKKAKAIFLLPFDYYFLGTVEQLFGTTEAAVAFYRQSERSGRNPLCRYYTTALDAIIAIGDCYKNDFQWELAYKHYKRALRFAKRTFQRKAYYKIGINLSAVCDKLNRPEETQKYEKLAQRNSRWAESTRENEADAEIIEQFRQGNTAQAFEMYRRHIYQKEAQLGSDSPRFKEFYKEKWLAELVAGEREQAMHSLGETIEFFRSTYGEESLKMADLLSSVASIFLGIGEQEDGGVSAQKALSICEKKGYLGTRAMVRAAGSLFSLYAMQGKMKQAEPFLSKIDPVDIARKDISTDCMYWVGQYFLEFGQYDRVEELCKQELKKPKPYQVIIIDASILMTYICACTNRIPQAYEYLLTIEKYLADKQTLYGADRVTGWCRIVGRIAFLMNNLEVALENVEQALEIRKELPNDLTQQYGCCVERAMYHTAAMNLQDAQECLAVCEDMLQQLEMPDRWYVELYHQRAYLRVNMGQYRQALNEYEKSLPLISGRSDYVKATVKNNLGWIYLNLGQLQEAEEEMLQAVGLMEGIGMTDCMQYCHILHNLSQVYERQQMWEQCMQLHRRIESVYDPKNDPSGSHGFLFTQSYLRILYRMGMYRQAAHHYKMRKKQFVKWYGETANICMTLQMSFENMKLTFEYEQQKEIKIDERSKSRLIDDGLRIANACPWYYQALFEEDRQVSKYCLLTWDFMEKTGIFGGTISSILQETEDRLRSAIEGLEISRWI